MQATFAATVLSASDAQPLGPSDGVVLFSMTGSNAFSFVHKTVLGTAKVSRVAVSGTASLTLHKDSAGLTLLPGPPSLPCSPSLHHAETFPMQPVWLLRLIAGDQSKDFGAGLHVFISDTILCAVLELGALPHAPYEVRIFDVAYVVIPDPKRLPLP